MRITTTLLGCTVAAALALSGCSSEPAEPDTSVSLPVDAPRVTVLGAGAAPTRLREFSGVSEQKVPLRITEGFAQTIGDASTPELADAPVAGSTFTTTVNVTGETDTNAALIFTELAEANGFGLHVERTATGQINSVRFAVPADATDDARATTERGALKLLTLPVVFPTEPIGEGAQWTVENRVAGESAMLQTTTYTLTAATNEYVEVDVAVEQRPTIGAIPDSDLKVLSSRTHSTGHVRIDLDKALPTAGSIDYTTRVIYGGESDTRVIQDSSTSVSFG